MDNFLKIVPTFLAAAFLVNTACLAADSKHVDVAPIADEVINTIVSDYGFSQSDPVTALFQKQVTQTITLLNDIENTTNSDVAKTKAILLNGLIQGFEELQKDIINDVYSVKSDTYKRVLITRFDHAVRALKSVESDPDNTNNIKKVKKLFFNIKSGNSIVKTENNATKVFANGKPFSFFSGAKKPVFRRTSPIKNSEPNFRQAIPKDIKENSKEAPLPAYTQSPISPNNVFASNEVMYLAQAPITPLEASTCSYNANDLAANTEVKLTPEITALAQKLNYSPAKILSYVTNNIEFEPYYGSLKGSQGTLISGAGNATDHASLLIALLRASNIPSRYVKGTAKFVNDQRLLDWLGVKTPIAAKKILSLGGVPATVSGTTVTFTHVWVEACIPYNNYRGLSMDNSGHRWIPLDASFKNKTYQQGIQLNVDFDYATYMATRSFDLPNEYFHGQVNDYIKTQPPRFNNNTIEDVPYAGKNKPLKIDILPASLPYQIQGYLAWGGTSSAEAASINAGHRYTFNINFKSNNEPTETLHLQKINTHNKGDISLNMSDILLKRVTLDSFYQGNAAVENTALQQYITWQVSAQGLQPTLDALGATFLQLTQAFGGDAYCRTDYKVRIRLDGITQSLSNATTAARCAIYFNDAYYAPGTHSTVLNGATLTWTGDPSSDPWPGVLPTDEQMMPSNTLTMTIRLDDLIGTAAGNPEIINNTPYSSISSFEYHALQAYGFQASDKLLETKANQLLQAVRNQANPDAAASKDNILGRYLDLVGLKYMRYITDSAEDIGRLHGETGLSGNHIGLTSSRTTTSYLFDLPYAVSTGGFLIDVKGGISKSANIETGIGSFKPFLLTGYASSAYESYIWQENARMDAVSSVRGIQFANEKGIEVLEITTANKTAQLAKLTSNADSSLNYSTDTVSTINGLVTGDATVTIPRSLIDYDDAGLWIGQVYIRAKGSTGGAAQATFAIGPYAGGYTVNDPISKWFDPLAALPTGWNIPITLQTPSIINKAPSILSSAINFGSNQYSTIGGDPVNMVTGNMYHTEKDISIEGRGLPIVFERTYNSMLSNDDNAQSTPLGYGWTHSFNHYLEFKDDDFGNTNTASDSDGITSSVTWVDGTAARKFITVNGNASGVATGASFSAPEGFYFQVNRLANGKYTLREKNGTTYTFVNVAGTVGQKAKLESISDRNNNTLTLSYIGNNLNRVTDDYGRYLQFAYNANNQIDFITDWSNRRYEYKYDLNNNLIEFHNPLAVAGTIQPVKYTYYGAEIHNNLTHFMQSYTLPRGNGMSFDYYTNGKIFRHTNTNGESITFTYNVYRREATTVNERGFVRKHFFDEKGNPTKVVKEGGGETTYTYDTLYPYNRTGQNDPMGYNTAYAYDSSGNVTTTTNPSGGTSVNSYFNAFHQPGKVKDPNDNYTLYKYDTFGNRTEVIKLKKGFGATIDPAIYDPSLTPNEVLSWSITSYDGFGNPLVIKQVRDFTTQVGPTLEYDYTDTVNNVNGLHPTTITRCGDRDGDTIINRPTECDSASLIYDALGRLTSGIDANWYPVTYEYDDVDRTIKSTDANGKLRDIEFDENGNAKLQKLVSNVYGTPTIIDQTSAVYDLSDRAEQSTNAGGFTSYFQYDASGNVTNVTNPDGYSVAFNYDANNQVVSAYDEEGHAVSRGLDISGRVRTIADPNGNLTKFDYYDSAKDGRLKRQYDALDRYSEFDYDLNGNVISVTAADSTGTDLRVTLSEYDALSRPIRVVGPVVNDPVLGQIRQVTKYQYDTLGNQTQMLAGYTDSTGTNPASDVVGVEETLTYDDLGRVLTKADAANKAWIYEYDLYSNVTKVTDPDGHITVSTYLYGGLLDVQTVYAQAGDPSPHITDYNYNDLGQTITVVSPEVTYSYLYDTAHRLIKVTDSRAGKFLFYEYSPGGLLTATTDSEGNEIDYLYDPVGRLSDIWAASGDLVNFNYDPAGRLVEKWFSNGVDTRISYNTDNTVSQVLNRAANGGLVSQHIYTYDGHGNRDTLLQQITGSVNNTRFEYDKLNRLIATKNINAANALIEGYSYDYWGNRTSVTASDNSVKAYIYDAVDPKKLIEIRQTDSNGALLTSFGYDNNGNIINKTEGATSLVLTYDALNRLSQAAKTGLPTETYQYDPQGNRIEKTVGATTVRFVYDGPDIAAQYNTDWTAATQIFTHGPQWDDPLIRTDAGGISRYYHSDALGSIVSNTNMAGGVFGSVFYNAWGSVIAGFGTIPQYSFTGREFDSTGLMYYRARYYDPTIGRFTQRDPKGYIDGINRYAYAINNPVNYTDPRGTSVFNNAFANSLTQSSSYFGTSTRQSFDFGTSSGSGLISSGTQSLAIEPGLQGVFEIGVRETFVPIDIALSYQQNPEIGLYGIAGAIVSKKFNHISDFASSAFSSVTKKIPHKNSLDYVGDTHVYRIKGPNGTNKIGESAQGTRVRDGASIRGEQQARRLQRETGDFYRSDIRKTFPNKRSARQYETQVIERFRRRYGQDTLPGNKTNR